MKNTVPKIAADLPEELSLPILVRLKIEKTKPAVDAAASFLENYLKFASLTSVSIS